MKQIALEGMIGYDVTAKDFRAMLSEMDDDVEILINSPGGIVTEGIAIYNAIRDYRRKEKGTVTARVVGMAASMATYIPMAADKIEIEDNAVWMIHNPWGFAIGDYNDMQKQGEILDGLARILAQAYARKTDIDMDEIRVMMDDETYLYGSEIVDAGFADDIVPAGEGAEDKAQAVALAASRISELHDYLRQSGEDAEDRDQLVAIVRGMDTKKPVVDRKKTASQAGQKQEGVMDINTLKTEHPDVFGQALAHGVNQERERVQELRAYVEADPANAKLREVVEEAIGSGKRASEINARLQVAIRDGGKQAGENPPIVGSATEHGPMLSDEERKLCKAMGISESDYIAASKEAE
jgi:ATP-dependent protease ClpP protease subunit